MSSQLISVVVPVYNEAGNIEPCLRGLWSALQETAHEILVCYDFDQDDTLPAIAAMGDAPPSLRLVKNDLGRGAAFALRAGFAAARGDVVVVTMADLSDPPEPIVEMVRRVREDGVAVVCGSRYMRGGSQTGGPWVKSTLSRTACLALKWVAGMGTHDATNNFKAYSAQFLAATKVESDQAFDIALELATKAHLSGAGVGEVPSSWVDRSAGDSRFQVWAWMPSYLRWWLRAMAAPLVVWAVLVGLGSASILIRSELELSSLGAWSPLLGVAAATACIETVRRIRGRMVLADVVLPLAWLLPAWLDWSWTGFESGAVLAAVVLGLGAASALSWTARRR